VGTQVDAVGDEASKVSRAMRGDERMPELARAWAARGLEEVVCGLRIFCVDLPASGGAAEDEAILVLHGFPSSSLDFHGVVGAFGPRRGILFDAPGFGMSEKPGGRSYSLHEVADVACALLASRGIQRIHAVAHDMGTSVLAELLARQSEGALAFSIESVLFFNGSIYVEMAELTLSQKLLRSPLAHLFARISSFPVFRAQMGRICGKSLAAPELEAMWQSLRRDDGHLRLPETIGYVAERYANAQRWTGVLPKTDLPASVVWGPLDTVAVMAIGERLARTLPRCELIRLDGLGHYPMIEDPRRVSDVLARWLDEVAPV